MKAIRLEAHGGPEQLKLHDVPEPIPGPDEALVEVGAAGVNFMDIGVRTGQLWRHLTPPFVPGVEGAGRVIALGEGVTTLSVGQRVSWVYVPGSYAERIVADADELVPVRDAIDDEAAAGLMMQGVSAHHFVTGFYAVKPGDVALVHAASGGVGLMLTQMIKLLGGRVIARVSTEDKAEIAHEAGADHVIVESGGTFATRVLQLTNGQGVHVVYDGSGAVTFDDSLASLRRHGVLAYYGPVLGSPKPINIATLPRSVLIGFPTFMDHVPGRAALLSCTRQLFDWVESRRLKVNIGQRYPLANAAQAHSDIASRRTTGKLLLIPKPPP
jgi:NADPH:quinone reductase